jgi:CheY-like chemotaxis protein
MAPMILLADDDNFDHFFFRKALKEISGVNPHLSIVKDGEQLINFLSTKSLPDVIFLDLNMPRKNGAECLIEIKKNPKLKDIPVVIFSTSFREDIADDLYKNGAHYYLQKCDFSELAESVFSILSLLAENPGQPPRDKFIFKFQA